MLSTLKRSSQMGTYGRSPTSGAWMLERMACFSADQVGSAESELLLVLDGCTTDFNVNLI